MDWSRIRVEENEPLWAVPIDHMRENGGLDLGGSSKNKNASTIVLPGREVICEKREEIRMELRVWI